jgi:2-haloacid dehalogenase
VDTHSHTHLHRFLDVTQDALGASVYGYRTFWVNRTLSPTERLPAAPEASGADLNDLVALIDQWQ